MEHAHHQQKTSIATTFINFMRRHYWVLFLLLLLFLFRKTVVSALLVIFLIGIGILSTLTTRIFNYNMGIELITFVTIVLAYAYNPFTALIAAIIMVFGSSVLQGRLICPITIGRYGTYVILCLLAGIFSGIHVTTAGKFLTIVYNLLLWAVYAMVKGFSLVKGAIPVVVSIALNFFLFSTFAQPLVQALE
ncbi:hypothetical protein HY488_01435 [Candidatus Woesearchaeota archaeon]|nr:hypothetical protein [Candidatus Woesearchaeota archaeon]